MYEEFKRREAQRRAQARLRSREQRRKQENERKREAYRLKRLEHIRLGLAKKIRLAPDEVQYIRDHYTMKDVELAEYIGCTPSAVWHRKYVMGLTKKQIREKENGGNSSIWSDSSDTSLGELLDYYDRRDGRGV